MLYLEQIDIEMNIGAIITGDIVDSTKLSLEDRRVMLDVLRSLPSVLSPIQDVSIDIFRGDSFQIGISDVREVLRAVLVIRASLRSHKMESAKMLLDARLAIGIGTLDYESDALSTSDGEAYRLSGKLLDNMGKSRLKIMTPWRSVNEELDLETAFADDIISSWTQSQSRIILLSLLTSQSHVELSQKLGISRQMVDKSLKASKEELMQAYIRRFETVVTEHLHYEL